MRHARAQRRGSAALWRRALLRCRCSRAGCAHAQAKTTPERAAARRAGAAAARRRADRRRSAAADRRCRRSRAQRAAARRVRRRPAAAAEAPTEPPNAGAAPPPSRRSRPRTPPQPPTDAADDAGRRRRARSSAAIRATLAARDAPTSNRVDYRALNADARTQYDTAKRFVAAGRGRDAREESGVCEEPGGQGRGARGAAGRTVDRIL